MHARVNARYMYMWTSRSDPHRRMPTTGLDNLNHMAALLAKQTTQLEPHQREFRVVCVDVAACAPPPELSVVRFSLSRLTQKTHSFLPQMP
jgi:hypothetical protein